MLQYLKYATLHLYDREEKESNEDDEDDEDSDEDEQSENERNLKAKYCRSYTEENIKEDNSFNMHHANLILCKAKEDRKKIYLKKLQIASEHAMNTSNRIQTKRQMEKISADLGVNYKEIEESRRKLDEIMQKLKCSRLRTTSMMNSVLA